MKTWSYTQRDLSPEMLPDVPRPAEVPVFTVREFPLPDRRRVYLANGVIGLRLPAVPLRGADVAVSGLVGRSINDGMECAAPAPYPCAADLIIGHDRLSDRPDLVTIEAQALDMAFGELTSTFAFRAQEARLAVRVLTFVPRSLPTVICQETVVTADRDCDLQIQAVLDPRGLPGRCRERRMPDSVADAVLWWETRDALATVGVAFHAQVAGAEIRSTRQNDWGNEAELCLRLFTVRAKAGQPVILRQIGALVPSIMHDEPHWQALRMVAYGEYQGFDRLRHENRKAWADLWRARPRVAASDPQVQRIVDSAFYSLHASVQPCTPGSLPPFGLSHTEGYYHGHVFIDHELFMFPPLLLTAPAAAQATLDYRTRRIPMARMNAASMGCRGIMFPWQSGLTGCEVTRPHSVSGIMEFSTPDIVKAFLLYADATGDELFRREDAWPVLRGAADWVCTRVTRTARGYEVRNLTASEGFANTHNDPATNQAFIDLLRQAMAHAARYGYAPPARWSEVAERILILKDKDALLKETAAADPAAATPVEERVHLPFGGYTDMLDALKAGDRAKAAHIWRLRTDAHWQPDFGAFREYGQLWNYGEFDMDCFQSDPGFMLRMLLLDLPRLTIGPGPVESWCGGPVVLPAGWDAIEAERIWIRDQPTRLRAAHGAPRAELDLSEGTPASSPVI